MTGGRYLHLTKEFTTRPSNAVSNETLGKREKFFFGEALFTFASERVRQNRDSARRKDGRDDFFCGETDIIILATVEISVDHFIGILRKPSCDYDACDMRLSPSSSRPERIVGSDD